jgi:hypothetical protein
MIWRERRRLIEDMRLVGDQLVAIGEAEAAKRFAQFGEDGEPVVEEVPPEKAVVRPPVDEPTVAIALDQPTAAAEQAPPV